MRRVAILRESGGLGDVVCTLPVAAEMMFRCKCDTEVTYFGLASYERLVMASGVVDWFVPVDRDERRPANRVNDNIATPLRWPYLDAGPVPFARYDQVADLWCPAFDVERQMLDRPRLHWKSRIQIFLEAAKCWPADCATPRVFVDRQMDAWAAGFCAQEKLRNRPTVVGLHLFASTRCRSWIPQRAVELGRQLVRDGLGVIAFESAEAVCRLDGIPGVHAVGHNFLEVAAIVKRCDLMVTVDSGLFHLAAAVGTPAIGLFGPTDGPTTAQFYPKATILQRQPDPLCLSMPCYAHSERRAKRCSMVWCRGLQAIDVAAVKAAVDQALGNRSVRQDAEAAG